MISSRRDNLPINQQSAIKCIITLVSALPILLKFFDSPQAMLTFDTARKLSSYRTGNDSIPVHLRNLEVLLKCLVLFTRDNAVKAIVEKHRAVKPSNEYVEKATSISLITRLFPYYGCGYLFQFLFLQINSIRHQFLHLPALQHSRMVVLQILRGNDGIATPKNIIETLYSMNFDAIGCFSFTTLSAIPARSEADNTASYEPEESYIGAWESLCAVITQESDSRPHVDSRSVDKLLETLLSVLNQEPDIYWRSHRILRETVLLIGR